MHKQPHRFHIPTMGLAYTIDSPIKVARFGISSAISIVEDRLIEMMRSHYYPTVQKVFHPIGTHEDDYRARRITDYLNLVDTIVQQQVEILRRSAFEPGSEIVKYFELLPDDNATKHLYRQVMAIEDKAERAVQENSLRNHIIAGSIDVNILTKVDRDNYSRSGGVIQDGSDAVSALRGYANSTLSNSSIIFSAGMNLRLFNYLEQFSVFDADENGRFNKKVCIKVSDYRSALVQGKYLAKKGIWVSEFRIESGLNCGGHAFATDGYLMGPVLEEFKAKKSELTGILFELYNKAIKAKGHALFDDPHPIKLSAQGGIGTAEEDAFLHRHYGIDSTGWGTPFLLVPEATTTDEATLKLLCKAKKADIVLSDKSPLGVKFHYLKGTTSDVERQERIKNGRPGSPCTEKHLAFNTEFTEEPICTASHKYQKLKIAQLQSLALPEREYKRKVDDVLDKECLCIGLSNAAAIGYRHPFVKNLHSVTICPGPNIVNFSKVVSLQTMIDHIYGRTDIITEPGRPHIFVAELHLYIDHLKEQLEEDVRTERFSKKNKRYASFYQNLREGITYYRLLRGVAASDRNQFIKALDYAGGELDLLNYRYEISEW
jgi:hypothetical protein